MNDEYPNDNDSEFDDELNESNDLFEKVIEKSKEIFTNPLTYLVMMVIGAFILLFCAGNAIHRDAQRSHLILKNAIQVSQEWAYFEGQKDAMNGDIRIKYDPESKKYSWTKNCWDGGALQPIFDPSKSEDINYFLTKSNLVK